MKVKQMMICLTIALFFISACNQPNSPEAEGETQGQRKAQDQSQQFHWGETTRNKDWTRSLFGPGPANYGFVRHQAAPYDPEIESNVTGKSFRSLNAPRQNEGDDQDLIRSEILDMPGLTPGMVILIGGHAWVNVTSETNLSKEQQEEQTGYIEQRLRKVNPRYEYEVNILGSNRRED